MKIPVWLVGQLSPWLARALSRVGTRQGLWLVCAGVVMVIGVGAVGVTVVLRDRAQSAYHREIKALDVALSEQTLRYVQVMDLLLQKVIARSGELHVDTQEDFRRQFRTRETYEFLHQLLQNSPQSNALTVTDATGRMVSLSRWYPTPYVDSSDRDYVRHFLEQKDDGLFISAPFEAKAAGVPVVVLARRLTSPNGDLLGVVAISLSVDNWHDLYQKANAQPGQSVTLLRNDGMVLVRSPDPTHQAGTVMPRASPWYDLVRNGGGSYRSVGYLSGGFPALVSVHPLRGFPLVLNVSIKEDEALAAWRQDAQWIGTIALATVAGFVILFWMIARQIQRQEEHRTRLRDFAELASDWFWEQDSALRFTDVGLGSPLVERGDQSHLGKLRWEINDTSRDPERWERHRLDVLGHQRFVDFRFDRIGADGKNHYVSISGVPVYDASGAFVGYRGTGRDITSDVEAAEAMSLAKELAEAANRAKSQFLANMGHELRTPLHAIIGFSELIHDQKIDRTGTNHTEWAADILASGRHLLNMINDMLELSKIDAGYYELADDRVDMSTVVHACLSAVRSRATEGQVMLESSFVGTDAVLRADRRAVRQIVMNLVTNAVKFTPSGGVVTVQFERATNGDLILVVTDTGIGIDEAALLSLGESFTQADASKTRKYGGTGLGLAISRKLIALHGGVLTIESTPGDGTTVRVVFPRERVLVVLGRPAALEKVLA